jgi:hypothetical protein
MSFNKDGRRFCCVKRHSAKFVLFHTRECPHTSRGDDPLSALQTRNAAVGIEPESDVRDLFTFECSSCGQLEVRGVLVTAKT